MVEQPDVGDGGRFDVPLVSDDGVAVSIDAPQGCLALVVEETHELREGHAATVSEELEGDVVVEVGKKLDDVLKYQLTEGQAGEAFPACHEVRRTEERPLTAEYV